MLSLSKGIVHPYYVSALAPGTAAMAGAGAVAFVALARGRAPDWGLALVAVRGRRDGGRADRADAPRALHGVVRPGARWRAPRVGVGALVALRRLAAPAVGAHVPAAARRADRLRDHHVARARRGHVPGRRTQARRRRRRIRRQRSATSRSIARCSTTSAATVPARAGRCLTVASDTAAPLMLLGLDAGALGGYSGTDPALDGPGLARLVARGQARYVLLGGEYSLRGGNRATVAVLRACRELAPSVWHSPDRLPVRPGAVRLRRARARARRKLRRAHRERAPDGARAQAATDSSRWKARANSSRSRPAAQRGTADSPSAIRRSSTRRPRTAPCSSPRTSWSRERSRSSASRSSTAQRSRRAASPGAEQRRQRPGLGHALAVVAGGLRDDRHLDRREPGQAAVEDQVARVLVVVVVVDDMPMSCSMQAAHSSSRSRGVALVQPEPGELVEHPERERATWRVCATSRR